MTIYATDYYANNPANLIPRQPLSIMQVPELQANLVIPTNAPFYAKDLELWYKPPGSTGSGTKLFLGIDYFFGAEFRSASHNTQLQVYSIIFLTDHNKRGSVELTYRTLGTEWSRDVNDLYERLIAQAIHPRKTTYENIANLPIAFPVIQHPHPVEEMYYQSDIINSLNAIATAINNRPNDTVTQVFNLLMQSLTKTNIGLGNVPNYSTPTAGIIQAGNSTTHFATINAVSQIVEMRLSNMGYGGVTTPGQPIVDVDPVTSSSSSVLNNEMVVYDGSTGQVIKSTGGRATITTSGNKTTLTLKPGAAGAQVSLLAQEQGGSGRTIELVFPMAFTAGSYSLNLPAAGGTLMRVEQLVTPAGQIPFNAGSTGGIPTGALAVSSAPVAGAVIRYDSNGRFTVVDPVDGGNPVNKTWAENSFLSKTDTTVLKSTAVIQANGVATAINFYSAQAINNKLADYVTATELADIIAGLQNGETGASALAVTQLTMGTSGATYDLIADTFNVVTATQNGTLRFPANPPLGSVVAIAIAAITPSMAITVNYQVPLLGTATSNTTMRTPNEYVYFQYVTGNRWVRINHGEFFLDGKNSASTYGRFRGSTAVIPDPAQFELGHYCKLSADVVVNGKTWRANSIITRTDNGWTYSHNDDTTDLEELYSTLITGFNNLNAAL